MNMNFTKDETTRSARSQNFNPQQFARKDRQKQETADIYRDTKNQDTSDSDEIIG